MLSEKAKNVIREAYKKLPGILPGFTARSGQRKMVGAIANTLAVDLAKDAPRTGSNVVVVEGRTGVGKTVGYLIPAIAVALEKGKKLVVSTATVGLQEQLYSRDLPAVAKAFDAPVKIGLAKGRGRYVCNKRLFAHSGIGDVSDQDMFAWDRRPESREVELVETLSKKLIDDQWSGDRDEYPEAIPQEIWSRISTGSSGCTKRRCSEFKACPYYQAVESLDRCDLIVANHDLVLSCISAGSQVLPSPEETIYVFDEAHHLPHIAMNLFQAKVMLRDTAKWLKKIRSTTSSMAVYSSQETVRAAHEANEMAAKKMEDLATGLQHSDLFASKNVYRFPNGVLPNELLDLSSEISKQINIAFKCYEKFNESVSEEGKSIKIQESMLIDLKTTTERLGSIKGAMEAFVKQTENGAQPEAKWIEKKETDAGDFMLNVSPISGDEALKEMLWNNASACALTSATITTLGRFDYFLKQSGLIAYKDTTTLCVESPFDYAKQGEIRIPKMNFDPKNAEGHTEEITAMLPQILAEEQHGSLVLFSSKKQMQYVIENAPSKFMADVIAQGTHSRAEVIDRHIEKVKKGQRSILFGLAGFGEGLDLPGDLCRHVVIMKIPFAPPDSPVDEAQAEWIERNGGNPFFEVSLPKAGVVLVQWVGRLIRKETDHGTVTICDTRLRTKNYGRQIISGLPPMRVIR